MPELEERHVYEIDDGEQHWYVALSSVAAVAAHRELLSEPALDCFVTELADDGLLTISFPDEEGRQPETRTCKEWAALEEGFLASTLS